MAPLAGASAALLLVCLGVRLGFAARPRSPRRGYLEQIMVFKAGVGCEYISME